MDYQKLFENIEALEKDYFKFWEDICTIESPTNDKAGVDAVGAFCIRKAQQFGWQVTVHEEAVSGNALCITMNPDAPGKAVCYSAHMDTVHPVGLFGTPAVRFDEEKIYGPGVRDCKGGIVASFLAMEALHNAGFTARPVKLILQSDEETSSKASDKRTIEFMAEMARDCEVFLNTESNLNGYVTMWRKGISKYRIDVTGKALHAGQCYKGVSAIREAACKIVELENFKDENGITMNTGIIQGGTAINTVPETCSFSIDVRFSDVAEMEAAHEFLEKLTETSFVEGSTATLTLVSRRPAMERTERNMQVLERMNAVYEAAGLPVLKYKGNKGGSDASDLTLRGITCVDSMGIIGDHSHSIREYALLSSLVPAAKYLAAAAMGL